jgi:hypothetical protein
MKAVETIHKSITYRSRLEARWAAFFENIGFRHIYEPEGFEHEGKRYLPDFWIDELDGYLEVKQHNAGEDEIKRVREWQRDMAASGMRLFSVFGEPNPDKFIMCDPSGEIIKLLDCRRCDGVCYADRISWGQFKGHTCEDHDRFPLSDTRIREAMEAAMREKFGEQTIR